jgi:hypothetical protein
VARIRTIKPEFWDSPSTAKATFRGRLFFIAMWNWADDYGVGTGNPKQLISFAFPNDDDVSAKDFPTLRKEVADAFDVVWYEVDGRPYYFIPSWDEHQRTERKAKRSNPGPDMAEAAGQSLVGGTSDDTQGTSETTHGSSVVGTGEQGKGKKEEKTRSPRGGEQHPDGFDAFWSTYPRKIGKKAAAKAFAKAVRTVPPDRIVQGAKRYAAWCQETHREPEFIAHPTTWLNAGRWDDQLGNEPDGPEFDPSTQPVEWLKAEWKAAAVQEIERLTSLRYPRPDPPSDPPPADFEAWRREDKRDWITANHQQIIQELEAGRDAA